MSNTSNKRLGSLADFIESNNQDRSRSIGSSGENNSQSGSQNVPEQIEEISIDQNEKTQDPTEALLQQIIAENAVLEQERNYDTQNTGQEYEQAVPMFEQEVDQTTQEVELPQPVEFFQPQVLPVHHNPIENGSIKNGQEALRVEALERWLEKPIPEKESKTVYTAFLYTSAILAVIFLTYTGVYISGNYQSFQGPLLQAGTLFTGGSSAQASNQKLSAGNGGDNRDQAGSNGDASYGDRGSSHRKTLASAFVIGAPNLKTSGDGCALPKANLSALTGGFTAIRIQSPCRSGQAVDIRYAGISYKTKFDQRGNINFILDCFLGDRQSIQITYEDGQKQVKTPVLEGMGSITKVAVIWSNTHNINLHAFEYGAAENKDGHVWEGNPVSLQNASQKRQTRGTGHGFMSSTSGFSKNAMKKIEVYTFLHSPDEQNYPGVIKLALAHKTKFSNLTKVSCNQAAQALLNYETIVLSRNNSIKKGQGQIALTPCKPQLDGRLMTKAIQDLSLGYSSE